MKCIKCLIFIPLLLAFPVLLMATHNRAGEITYRHLGGYNYEFTITTYTYRFSNANRNELSVEWGDNSSSVIPLTSDGHVIIPGTDYYHNTYIGTHNFPGPGTYEILMEDPNRNLGVNNIPNSVNVIFSIKTTLLVGSSIGSNNTPVLLNPPINKAAKGHVFIHNPAAYDPDGDSLSFAITVCTGADGEPIDGYILPSATDTLLIDEVTGDLIWNTPAEVGVYNIAIFVEEWRNSRRIGRIARDMQIDVYETDNQPPVTDPVPDLCVLAGDTVNLSFHFTDADGDQMRQEMFGGPFVFISDSAIYNIESVSYGELVSSFYWETNCVHARKQPYEVVIRTEDITGDINLSDITSFFITVLHKAPENLVTLSGLDTIALQWSASNCGNPAGYKIYRRLGSQSYVRDSCETGVPGRTGYELIAVVDGGNNTSFTDDNDGQGLVPGFDYCYRITAFYNDGAESISSEEVCTTLVPGTPPILKVSVLTDDAFNGEIEVAWAVPQDLDTLGDGIFQYRVYRMDPGSSFFNEVGLVPASPSNSLADTTFLDNGINTILFPYTYTVILFYQEDGDWRQYPGNENASSQYIEIDAADNQLTLNMRKRSPWLNTTYEVFRERSEGVFDNIGTVIGQSEYTDTALVNNREYTYYTVGGGIRPVYGLEYSTLNKSHLASGIPVDTIPPCPPIISKIDSECDSVGNETFEAYNVINWRPSDTCFQQDIIYYVIYSRDSLYGEFIALDTVAPEVDTYIHYPEVSIEQCYAVAAVDSSLNQSVLLPYCVFNTCGLYTLPNVFTPNNDGINDIYLSWNLNNYIRRINMTIYNRYGKPVYNTEDPAVNWDGSYNGRIVSSGVYYYICDVYEPRITGTVVVTLTGFIHVYSGETNEIAR